MIYAKADNIRTVASALVALLFCLNFPVRVLAETAVPDSTQISEQKKHFTVRKIIVKVREIFDEPDLGWFYRTTNSLKVNTREEVVRRELIISEGKQYDPFLVDESIRNLRSLPFLRRISIRPIFEGEWVDLYVEAQDTWTLFPFLTASSGGGTSRTAVGFTESNLAGFGKRVEALVADDEGRQKVEAVWQDPRVFGTRSQFALGHFIRSDGDRSYISLGRPFRSVVETYAWNTVGDNYDLIGRLFDRGDERYLYRQRRTALAGAITYSAGDPRELRRRYTLGYAYQRDDFSQADRDDFDDLDIEFDPQLNSLDNLAEDRRFNGPTIGLRQIAQDFVSSAYVDSFDRVQDYNLGSEINAAFQVAPTLLNSLQDSLLASGGVSSGLRTGSGSFLRGGMSLSSRLIAGEGIQQIWGRLEAKYINLLGNRFFGAGWGNHTLLGSLVIDLGEDLDKDFEFLLGAGNGLRGYKDRSFTGDQRITLNLENRAHFVEDVLRLFSVGGAVFLDAGGTSDDGLGDVLGRRVYADVGMGLRFGLTRSGGSGILRVDLAFPLRDGPEGSDVLAPRLLISTGQAFSSSLSSDSSNSAPTISAGLLQ